MQEKSEKRIFFRSKGVRIKEVKTFVMRRKRRRWKNAEFEYALAIFGESEIDNQRFKYKKLLIVRRP